MLHPCVAFPNPLTTALHKPGPQLNNPRVTHGDDPHPMFDNLPFLPKNPKPTYASTLNIKHEA